MGEKKEPDRMSERVRRTETVDEATDSKDITNSLRLNKRQARSTLIERAKREDVDVIQIEESDSYEFATKLRKELKDHI